MEFVKIFKKWSVLEQLWGLPIIQEKIECDAIRFNYVKRAKKLQNLHEVL